MKILLTIAVAALAALAGRTLARVSGPPAAVADPAAGADLAELRAALEELRAENRRLEEEARRRTIPVASPAPLEELGGVDDDEIRAALERWRAAHPVETDVAGEPPAQPAVADGERAIDDIPMLELVQALSGAGFSGLERQQLFEKLRKSGRIDEYLAAIEKLAAESPEDADLQVALGHAYLQKLFGIGNSPEAGPLAMASDAAFDRALEIDDQSWQARFSKAVALSNWPAFLGRGPEAIEHFEILLEQQSAVPARPEFAMTYLFLGNMYQGAGDRDEAVATWRAGLELFPDVDDLRRALELAGESDDRGR